MYIYQYHYDLLQKQSIKNLWFFVTNILFKITFYSLLHQIHMQHYYLLDHKYHLPSNEEFHIHQELMLELESTLCSLLHQIHMLHCYLLDHKYHLPSIQELHIYQELESELELELESELESDQDPEKFFPRKYSISLHCI